MSRIDWDHNAFYHRRVERHLPRGSTRVLDVGCGTGKLAARLSRRATTVDAIDISPTMIAAARERRASNVNWRLGDVSTDPLPPATYDAVVSLMTLHHLPLAPTLATLADAVRPGGKLFVIALPRVDLPRELPVEIAAAVCHRGLGTALALVRGGGRRALALDDSHALMPVELDPEHTTREVRAVAREVLPGSTVRRLLLWRYALEWTKPTN